MNNFVLNKIEIYNYGKCIVNTNFTDGINLNINNENDDFYSLIIGENASGKSYLLFLIADIFSFLDKKINRKPRINELKYEKYNICYSIKGKYYDVAIQKNQVSVVDEQKENLQINELVLPTRIIASSYLFNDKFKFSLNENDSIYKYCGVKQTSNAMFLSHDSKKLLKNIVKLNRKEKIEVLTKTLSNVGYENKITIQGIRSNKSKMLSLHELIDQRKNRTLVNNIIEKMDMEEQHLLEDYVNENQGLKVDLELKNFDENHNKDVLLNHIRNMDILTDIGYYNRIDISFYKDDEAIDFHQLSSGEKQLLSTFLSIGSELEDNSLILIDEPEVSLHPNWQLTFIHQLENVLGAQYKNCHFIISTHSHLMVSSLYPERSSLVINTREGNIRKSELILYDTYAWSAENILYRVFGVRTLRNIYVENDLQRLINYISKENKNDSLQDIQEIINNLKKIELTKDDPLTAFLEKVDKKIEGD